MHIAKFPGVTTFNAADVFTLKYCLIESGRSFVISFVEKTTGVPASLLPRPGAMDAPISLSTVLEYTASTGNLHHRKHDVTLSEMDSCRNLESSKIAG